LSSEIPHRKAAVSLVRTQASLGLMAAAVGRPAKVAAIALLRGGAKVLMDEEELIGAAYDWCSNLQNPAALVAGAVIATIYETMSSGDLNLKKSDDRRTKIMKKVTRLLLLSAFALEVFSIFVTTVTGTMLLSKTYDIPEAKHYSAISFLRENFEFEYLTARLTFLQGLLNWLAAIGLNHAIPGGETGATRKINKLVAWSLSCTGILMLSFWNTHLTHYNNYATMVLRWFSVTWTKFLWKWPPQPLTIVLVPSLFMALKMAYEAFSDDSTGDEE
jgi:cytochrome bd-type quinol oxidase subunit 2